MWAFGWELTHILAPGVDDLTYSPCVNYSSEINITAELRNTVLHRLECPRGWAFENRNCQIPNFAPSVPALGEVGETINRCISTKFYREDKGMSLRVKIIMDCKMNHPVIQCPIYPNTRAVLTLFKGQII